MIRETVKVAYVVKRYPRLSETFILNEILAHEAAGMDLDLFALLPPEDTHFQEGISRVRTPVTYLPFDRPSSHDLWSAISDASDVDPKIWCALSKAKGQQVHLAYQALALVMHIRRKHITHLHAHFALSTTTVARLAASLAGISYSFTAHAKDIFHESVDPDDLNRKMLDATSVVTVSDFNLAYLRSRHSGGGHNIRLINYGVDLTRLPFLSPRVRPRNVVAVGRLVEKKGFSVLVDACAFLVARQCPFHCTIIGGGALESDLRSQIDRLGLRDHVELVGSRPQHDVAQYIQQASVMVAPCVVAKDGDRDGLPNVLLEAMALGTPCVSTNVVGIPELVVHAKTGLLTQPFDASGLATAIADLLGDAQKRVSLASVARQVVESNFDVVQTSALLRDVFADSEGKGA